MGEPPIPGTRDTKESQSNQCYSIFAVILLATLHYITLHSIPRRKENPPWKNTQVHNCTSLHLYTLSTTHGTPRPLYPLLLLASLPPSHLDPPRISNQKETQVYYVSPHSTKAKQKQKQSKSRRAEERRGEGQRENYQ